MQYETPARTISFLYQNHQDTPSEFRDLYKSIFMPDSQPRLFSRDESTMAPTVTIWAWVMHADNSGC